jgi:hypothetical protein
VPVLQTLPLVASRDTSTAVHSEHTSRPRMKNLTVIPLPDEQRIRDLRLHGSLRGFEMA